MAGIEVKKHHTFLGHTDSIYTLARIDEQRFLSAGGDGMVVMWDVNTLNEGEVVAKVNHAIYAIHYDPFTDVVYIGENNDGLHAIDLKDKKEVASAHLGDYQIFEIKTHQDLIWVGLQNGELVVLNKDLETVSRKKYASERIRSLDFFGNELAMGLSDHSIQILDLETLKLKQELKGHKNSVFSLAYHPSGKYLLSGGRDAQLKVWDTKADYIQRESIAAHLYTINHVSFINNGRHFISCSMDKAIKLWDAHNFKLLKVLDKHRHASHGNSVNHLLWMNFNDLLVSCSDDRSISVWELKINK